MISLRRFTLPLTFTLTLLSLASAHADQSLAGHVTITGGAATGNLFVTGLLDVDGNSVSFGTQGATFGAALFHTDSNADTFTFLSNRNPASWLWLHNAVASGTVPAMRLDSAHQLILYQADGTTAGLTFAPASNSLKLGTHASGTLTADANGVITAGGGFTVAGNFANTSGNLTGGATGLSLNAGGTNQNITLNSSAAGDVVFNTNGVERARIKSSGNVGIGTASPSGALEVSKANPVVWITDTGTSYAQFAVRNSSSSFYFGQENASGGSMLAGSSSLAGILNMANANSLQLGTSNIVRMTITSTGNVGIGTASPGFKLDVRDTTDAQIAALETGSGNGNRIIVGANANEAYIQESYSSYAKPLTFKINTTEMMRINPTGNVGIGTSAPTAKLEVKGPNTWQGTIRVNSGAGQYSSYGWMIGDALQWSAYAHPATSPAGGLLFANATGSDIVTFSQNGSVGIGTMSPLRRLHIQGSFGNASVSPQEDLLFVGGNELGGAGGYSGIQLGGYVDGRYGNYIRSVKTLSYGSYWNTALTFNVTRNNTENVIDEAMRIASNGNVGIGTTAPTHKLSVKGTIRAQEVIVDNTNWADYVFEEDYRLAPLAEVEQHIRENKHLPGIPSAAEVAEHGVSMGDMQAKLLSKIEEITLHQIAQEKEILALKAQNVGLQQQLAELKAAGAPEVASSE